MSDNKKSLKELKHALWLKNKKENGEINQTAKIRDGKKRKAQHDRNSKSSKNELQKIKHDSDIDR